MGTINEFSGGVNTKHAAHLIPTNQAVELTNCDISDGSIRPFPSGLDQGIPVSKYFNFFNSQWISSNINRDYVEYNKRLYYSDGFQAKWTADGINFLDLGVDAPSGDLTANKYLSSYPVSQTGSGYVDSGTQYYRLAIHNGVDYDLYNQTVEVVSDNSQITFTIPASALGNKLYRKVNNEFVLVGQSTTTSLTDGQAPFTSVGTVQNLNLPSVAGRIKGGVRIGNELHYLEIGYSSPGYYPTTNHHRYNVETGGWTNVSISGIGYVAGEGGYSYNAIPAGYAESYWDYRLGNPKVLMVEHLGNLYVIFSYWAVEGSYWVKKTVVDKWSSVTGWNTSHYYTDAGTAFDFDDPSYTKGDDIICVDTVLGQRYGFNIVSKTMAYYPGIAALNDTSVGYATQVELEGTDIWAVLAERDQTGHKIAKWTSATNSWEIFPRSIYISAAGLNSLVVTTKPRCYQSTANMYRIGDNLIVPLLGAVGIFNITVNSYNVFTTSLTVSDLKHVKYLQLGNCGTTTNDGYNWFIGASIISTYVHKRMVTDLGVAGDLGSLIEFNQLKGDYSWVYTLWDVGLVNESSPGTSDSLVDLDGEWGKLIIPAGINPTINPEMSIYRIGGTQSEYREVVQIPTSTTQLIFRDNVADIDLGGVLTTSGTSAAPNDILYITEHRGRLFGVSGGSKLYYSDIGNFAIWSALHFIQLPRDVTSIGSTPNSLVVCSDSETYALFGNSDSDFSLRILSKATGCMSHKTMQEVEGNVMFVDKYGLHVSNGLSVTNATAQKLSRVDLVPEFSTVHNYVYMTGNKDSILYFDLKTQAVAFKQLQQVDILNSITGILYGSNGNTLFNMETDTNSTNIMRYKSGELSGGNPSILKEYNKVKVAFIGEWTLKIYIGRTLVNTKTLSSEIPSVETINVKKSNNKGLFIQFEMEGIGYLMSIDYSEGVNQ